MSLNRNYFTEAFKLLSYPLIACNAFSMCSDVLPSLAYFGISGSVTYILLAAIFSVWLFLYLSKASSQSKIKIELEYYENKLMELCSKDHSLTDEYLFYARYWVIFNEFRVKIYKSIIENGYNKKQLHSILNRMKCNEKYIYGELVVKVKEMLSGFLSHFNSLVEGQGDKKTAYLDALILKDNNIDEKHIFGNFFPKDKSLRNKIMAALKIRDPYLIRYNTLLRLVLCFATANIVVNALTMYGGAAGVIRALASIFGPKVYLLDQKLLSVVFFLAGGCASLNLTYPMIQRFGRKLELVFQDFNYSVKNFSWYTVLAAIMAFFTAVGSAIFTLYNSPISGMMPPLFAGYAKLFTVLVAFFSVFSLYFISVSSKFQEWFSSGSPCKIYIYDVLLAGLVLFMSFLADITFLPSSYYGILEVSALIGVGSKLWGWHGFFISIALLAAFSFSVTSFHQFSILFNSSLLSRSFILLEVLFQFSTFTVTFYYGLNKFFAPSDVLLDAKKNLTEIPSGLKSNDIKPIDLNFGSTYISSLSGTNSDSSGLSTVDGDGVGLDLHGGCI